MARPVDLRCELAACIAVAGSVVAAVGRWRPWLEGQRYPRKRKSCQARGRTPGDPPQVAAEAAAERNIVYQIIRLRRLRFFCKPTRYSKTPI